MLINTDRFSGLLGAYYLDASALTQFDEAELMDGDVTVRIDWSTINYKDGLAVTGNAVARAFVRRGFDVRVADDSPTADHARFAVEIGATLHDVSTSIGIDRFLDAEHALAHHHLTI